MRKALILFDRDLRCTDHAALSFAADNEMSVLGAFFLGQSPQDCWPRGAASKWWLHHSLASHSAQLEKIGVPLLLRKESAEEGLEKILRRFEITDLLLSRGYDSAALGRESFLQKLAEKMGIELRTFHSSLLWEPWQIQNQQGKPYQVFTAFWRQCLQKDEPSQPRSAPKKLNGISVKAAELGSLDSLELLPKISWDSEFSEHWKPGEVGAQENLRTFVRRLAAYEKDRDFPATTGTS